MYCIVKHYGTERIDLEEYLSYYPEEMNIIVISLGYMIIETVQDIDEVIKLKSSSNEKIDLYVPLIHVDHVNLEFARGTELKDQYGMLKGTGKKIRNLKIHKPGEIKSNELKKILLEQLISILREIIRSNAIKIFLNRYLPLIFKRKKP